MHIGLINSELPSQKTVQMPKPDSFVISKLESIYEAMIDISKLFADVTAFVRKLKG